MPAYYANETMRESHAFRRTALRPYGQLDAAAHHTLFAEWQSFEILA